MPPALFVSNPLVVPSRIGKPPVDDDDDDEAPHVVSKKQASPKGHPAPSGQGVEHFALASSVLTPQYLMAMVCMHVVSLKHVSPLGQPAPVGHGVEH
jgi:hypothetical protein